MGQSMTKVVELLVDCQTLIGNYFGHERLPNRSLTSKYLCTELPLQRRVKLREDMYEIYWKLFIEHQDYDVEIVALDASWKLHRAYLMQSEYFRIMFSKRWREGFQGYVHIRIVDRRITLDSLNATFASFYLGDIYIDANNLFSILATASFLQVDSIIEKCGQIMLNLLNKETAELYYNMSYDYDCKDVADAAAKLLDLDLIETGFEATPLMTSS